jgi:hypothetical protein
MNAKSDREGSISEICQLLSGHFEFINPPSMGLFAAESRDTDFWSQPPLPPQNISKLQDKYLVLN